LDFPQKQHRYLKIDMSLQSARSLPERTDTRMIDTMLGVLKERFGVELQRLDLDQPLASLGLDSLAFVEYTFELEKALKITLPDVPRDTVTVGDLVAFINSEMSKQR
jgi:acyl carrier protein